MYCQDPDLNWRHEDFQSTALPTELSRLCLLSYKIIYYTRYSSFGKSKLSIINALYYDYVMILGKKLFKSICIEIKSTLRKNISWHSNFTFQTLTSTQMINTNVFNDDIFFINISMKFENHRMQSTFILLLFYQERIATKESKNISSCLKVFHNLYNTLL